MFVTLLSFLLRQQGCCYTSHPKHMNQLVLCSPFGEVFKNKLAITNLTNQHTFYFSGSICSILQIQAVLLNTMSTYGTSKSPVCIDRGYPKRWCYFERKTMKIKDKGILGYPILTQTLYMYTYCKYIYICIYIYMQFLSLQQSIGYPKINFAYKC